MTHCQRDCGSDLPAKFVVYIGDDCLYVCALCAWAALALQQEWGEQDVRVGVPQ
jgi:hypothetical protein